MFNRANKGQAKYGNVHCDRIGALMLQSREPVNDGRKPNPEDQNLRQCERCVMMPVHHTMLLPRSP